MKKSPLIAIALCVGLLAGCSSKAAPKAESHSESSQSVKESHHEDEDDEGDDEDVEPTLWDSNKATALSNFMAQWGQSMGQQYKEYGIGNNVNFYGGLLPDDFSYMPPATNDGEMDYEWTDDGQTDADYGIVAMYSDADFAEERARATDALMPIEHLYLFTIHRGNPIVLITEQNQGMPDNHMYFNPTRNVELQNGFTNIVNGDD